jgi:hypothetical protein
VTAGADEEVQVGAGVGLQHVVGVEAGPAAGGRRRRSGPLRAAARELLVGHLEREGAGRDVERDPVAGADQRERAAGGGLGGDVQHDRAVGGAGHPAVADPHHVPYAAVQQLLRQRHVGHLGHAGIALRTAVADDQHGVLVGVEVRIGDNCVVGLLGVED